jgi:phosphoglycerol transferase MdoB-like AlkP superfamily enzyme
MTANILAIVAVAIIARLAYLVASPRAAARIEPDKPITVLGYVAALVAILAVAAATGAQP